MKKFKLWDEVREVDPSEENKVIITALDSVIENICKIHTFQTMFENLEYSEYLPNDFEKCYDFRYGNLKDFLEYKFISVGKKNKWYMCPPFYYWIVNFNEISLYIKREQMLNLLSKNYDFYKEKIIHRYDDIFHMDIPLYYDLTENKFISHI